MITGVNVAVVLNNHRAPTGWLMMANRTRRTDKIGKRPFDIHHENLADVAFDPVVEYRHQKFTELLGVYRPFRQFALNIAGTM